MKTKVVTGAAILSTAKEKDFLQAGKCIVKSSKIYLLPKEGVCYLKYKNEKDAKEMKRYKVHAEEIFKELAGTRIDVQIGFVEKKI